MTINTIHNVYFIGIGGIGMSAIARYFSANGKHVAGYDKTPTSITESLQNMGVNIHFEDATKNIPISFLDSEQTLVVYTPAVPRTHIELNYLKDNGFTVLKRAEVLGLITASSFCLAIAGTHGKTTTSSILGHIMQPLRATAFLGGITENYGSNLILGDSEISVVEADEFDRSFLQLSPNIACVTSMDADHLDIYNEHQFLIESFRDFAQKVSGTLVVAKGLPLEGLTYAIDEEADYKAYNIYIDNGDYVFDVDTPTSKLEKIKFSLPGRHNIMNALAAIAMADIYGVGVSTIKEQLQSFKGVQRRFSYKIKTESLVLIDDYAHHPTEINAVYDSVVEMYPQQQNLVVFQPHLYSRTRDFMHDFAKVLSLFNEVLVLDIYPARELPIQGVTSKALVDLICSEKKELVSKRNLGASILASNAKVVVMLGAGDIGLEVVKVQGLLEKAYKIL